MGNLRIIKKLAAAALLASALAFGGSAAPAHAQSVEHVDFSDSINDTVTDLCAFPVQITGVSSGHVQAFRNDAGGFIRVTLHYSVQLTLSANGKTLTENDKYNQFDVDFQGGGAPQHVIHTGLMVRIKGLPGVNLIQSGRIIDDVVNDTVIFEKGNVWTVEKQAALCAALS